MKQNKLINSDLSIVYLKIQIDKVNFSFIIDITPDTDVIAYGAGLSFAVALPNPRTIYLVEKLKRRLKIRISTENQDFFILHST